MPDDANQGRQQPGERPPGHEEPAPAASVPAASVPAPAATTPPPPPSDTQGEPAAEPPPYAQEAAAASGVVGATPDTLTRFVAFLIDAVAVAVIGLVPVIGGLVGIAYVLFRDGLDIEYMRGRSLGKTLMKLTVVRADAQPMDLATSARRNWPLVFGSLTQILLFIPVIGWILIPFVIIAGAVFVIIEIVRVLTNPEGKRLGDGYADTRVIVAQE